MAGDPGGVRAILAVYLVLLRGDEVLLQRRRNTRFGAGQYGLVSGKADGGETAPAALAREAREEAGVDVAPEDLRCVHAMHRATEVGEWVDLFFTADRWSGEPRILEPEKADDLVWRRLDDLPVNMVPYVRRALARWRAGETLSLYGWAPGEG